MTTYRLETKNYKWLLFYGLGQIIIAILALIMSKYTGRTSLINIISASLDVIWFSTFPIGAIIAGIVSKKLNRPVALWFIFALILSPIALIILSKKKYHVETDINSIYRKYETKYFDSIGRNKIQVKKGKITQQQFEENNKLLLVELESAMNIEIREKENEIITRLNKPISEASNTIYPESNDTKIA